MRLTAAGLTALALAAATTGCDSSTAGTTAATPPALRPDQLRAVFDHARTTEQTVLVTARGQEGPDALGQDCQVRYVPAAESSCLLTRRDESMGLITLPQASYVAQFDRTPADGVGTRAEWRRLAPHGTDMSDFSGVLAQIVGLQAGISDDVVLADGVSTVTDAAVDPMGAGGPAIRYDLNVNGGALYRAMAAEVGSDSFREALLVLAGDAGRTAAHLWIGVGGPRDGLPLQQVITEPAGRYGAGDTETIRYTRWGAPVDIQAPPANHVTGTPRAAR
jgi:hypothetical protein